MTIEKENTNSKFISYTSMHSLCFIYKFRAFSFFQFLRCESFAYIHCLHILK